MERGGAIRHRPLLFEGRCGNVGLLRMKGQIMKNEKSGAGTAPAEFESTIGEYRVGVPFNPSGNHHVDNVKLKAAELIDEINNGGI